MNVLSDRTALLRAATAHPEEDTPRLLLADWLDGQDTRRVPCPECDGGRKSVFKGSHVGSGYRLNKSGRCVRCDGCHAVIDTTNAEQAELIRVQVELSRELVKPEESVTPHISSLLQVGYHDEMPCIQEIGRAHV